MEFVKRASKDINSSTLLQLIVGIIWIIFVTTMSTRLLLRTKIDRPSKKVTRHVQANQINMVKDRYSYYPEKQEFIRRVTKITTISNAKKLSFKNIFDVYSVTSQLPSGACGLAFDAEILKGSIVSGRFTIVAFQGNASLIAKIKSKIKLMETLIKTLKLEMWTYLSDAVNPFHPLLKAAVHTMKYFTRNCSHGDESRMGLIVFQKQNIAENVIRSQTYAALAFIGNCVVPPSYYLNSATSIRVPISCMWTERETRLELGDTEWGHLQQIKDFILRKTCSIQDKLMTRLIWADDLVSTTPSVGAQMRGDSNDSLTNDRKHLLEEIDGRVSELVRKHYSSCHSDPFDASVNTPTRKMLLQGEITDLNIFSRHVTKFFVMATFENGQQALGKVLHSCTDDGDLGEGLKEIMAYYIDRALGINRFPHVAIRRLHLSSSTPGPIEITIENNRNNIKWNWKEEERVYYNKYFGYAHGKGSAPYIDIVFIGYMKNLKRMVYSSYADLHHSLIARNNMENMASLSRQALRDATDIVILDFISHNFDRKGDNVVRSELRLAAFDAGHGFRLIGPLPMLPANFSKAKVLCERQLERPPFVQFDIILRAEIPSSCTSLPISRRSCHFSKFTLDRIRELDTQKFVDTIKRIVDREAADYVDCFAVKTFRIYEGLRQRMQYLRDYVDDCHLRFHDAMYI